MTHTLQVLPIKPKRARSAYNYFFHDERKRLQEMHQEENGRKASYAAISKLVAARWKLISSQDKLHYESLAAKDKYRFGLEMIQWKTHQLEDAKDQSKASRSLPEFQSEPRCTPNSTAKREDTQVLPDLPREQNFMDMVASYAASHSVLSESYDVSGETSSFLPSNAFMDELSHTWTTVRSHLTQNTESQGRSGSSAKGCYQVSFDQKQYCGFHSTDGFYHNDVFDAMDNIDALPDGFDLTTVFD